MSIMGPIPQSDDSYPIRALYALEETMKWLYIRNASDPVGALNLFYLFEHMKHHTEFQPVWCSNESAPVVVGGTLEYRLPVWAIFAEVLSNEAPTSVARTDEALATWFQELVRQVYGWKLLEQELQRLCEHQKLSEAGVRVVVDDADSPAAVRINLDPELSGKNAATLVEKIIPELIERMRKHIEQGRT